MSIVSDLLLALLRPRRRGKYLARILARDTQKRPGPFIDLCKSLGLTVIGKKYLSSYDILIDINGRSITEAIIVAGSFQSDTFELLDRLLPEKSIRFINIGANIGTSCINAHSIGFRHFLALEPVKSNYNLLSHNLEQLRPTSSVTLMNVGAGSEAGRALINLNPTSIGRHSLVADFKAGTEEIEIIRMDDILEREPGFLFIDTEGYELNVLQGARHYLEQHALGVCLEVTPELVGLAGVQAIGALLKEVGFKSYMTVEGGPYAELAEIPWLRALKQIDVVCLK